MDLTYAAICGGLKAESKVTLCVIFLCATASLGACTYTSGTNVSADQAKQFVVGKSTVADVEGKLGQPTGSQTNSDGIETLQYAYYTTHQDALNYVPIVGLVHNHVEQTTDKTTFIFSSSGVLQSYSTGGGGSALSN